ncbi:MAG: M20/M25/M40 family metallo-hydrolase [Bacteroidales bacterium]|jgi:hypothetical protein|nr:M20/M25/M40 family metallo-hydrolase [Bacteroidales bacterium]
MKKQILILLTLFLALSAASQTMKQTVHYLASAELQGRKPLSKGDTLARQYIAARFEKMRLKPLFDTWFQEVRLTKDGVEKAISSNVVAVLEGNDAKLKKEYVVVGAHFDHLGINSIYSMSKDTIGVHYGADDNASGVALMLQMAEMMSKGGSARSLIFVAFTCEEQGLLGSAYFVEHLPIKKEQIVAMVNYDMVGKLRDNTISVGGSGTSLEAEQMIKQAAEACNLKVKLEPSGMGPSDHASFYAKEIPVFFIHTTADSTYHTPNDKAEFLNYEGMDLIARFASKLLGNITSKEDRLTFQRSIDPVKSNPAKMKATLGIMPDHSGTTNGVKVEIVSKDRAAERAGVKAGDLIVEINGEKIGDLYQYMEALSRIDADQTKIKVVRDNKTIELIIKF